MTAEADVSTAEILRAVKRVQLKTRKAVTDMVAGGFRSSFRGSGMEFDEVREYVPGDDVRSIDWNVTARTGRPHIKKFVEEREQTIFLVHDLSASTRLGSAARSVRQSAAELAAILAFSAVGSDDRVGYLGVTDRIELELPPRGGLRQAFRIVREALYVDTEGKGTDLDLAADHLMRVLKRRAYIFLLSDFLVRSDPRKLGMLARRHDVVALHLVDARHSALPPVGLLRWTDPETGESFLLDTNSRALREAYAARGERRADELRTLMRGRGIDLVEIPIGESVVDPLIAYLHRRERRL